MLEIKLTLFFYKNKQTDKLTYTNTENQRICYLTLLRKLQKKFGHTDGHT